MLNFDSNKSIAGYPQFNISSAKADTGITHGYSNNAEQGPAVQQPSDDQQFFDSIFLDEPFDLASSTEPETHTLDDSNRAPQLTATTTGFPVGDTTLNSLNHVDDPLHAFGSNPVETTDNPHAFSSSPSGTVQSRYSAAMQQSINPPFFRRSFVIIVQTETFGSVVCNPSESNAKTSLRRLMIHWSFPTSETGTRLFIPRNTQIDPMPSSSLSGGIVNQLLPVEVYPSSLTNMEIENPLAFGQVDSGIQLNLPANDSAVAFDPSTSVSLVLFQFLL
jgi:hypothetical protein